MDINAFLNEMLDIMKRDAESCGIRLFSDFSETLTPILSDPSQLQQVFLNLIKNAIEAHDEKSYGNIYIATAEDNKNKAIKVTITDTGTGIRSEHL